MDRQERRYRIYWVPYECILNLLNWHKLPNADVVQFSSLAVPDGAKVIAVRDGYHRQALEVIVEHPEFDDVPDGQIIPDADVCLSTQVFRIPVEKLEESVDNTS